MLQILYGDVTLLSVSSVTRQLTATPSAEARAQALILLITISKLFSETTPRPTFKSHYFHLCETVKFRQLLNVIF